MNKYGVIVVGAGHAGIEAALASARLGCKTLLITLRKDTIGLMSCNPAIGGVGKGQLVKEIDALGGEMAKAADACGIQFRVLNATKGAAVQSSRAQIDRRLYQKHMQDKTMHQKNLWVTEQEAVGLITKENRIQGVITNIDKFYSECVVITTGTFLNGIIHIGKEEYQAGRRNEPASIKLSASLKDKGIELKRLKTCTTPRLNGKTIDKSKMKLQPPDEIPKPFSFSSNTVSLRQLPCYLTYTNRNTHRVIQDALKDKELFHIISQGVNPRYCPSIEEKIMRFPEKDRHQLFIEPEGLDVDEYYANGLFTFLSLKTQEAILDTIPGLEEARITKPGYGIEYDFAPPTQLNACLETRKIKNLFLAGQINGTTGYEEAAAQGLIAGINAALRIKGKSPFVLERCTSYIGVLIDDLITKGTQEPYRMFTSRVEYRLILREDNADLRLKKMGFELGLVSEFDYELTSRKQKDISRGTEYLKQKKITLNSDVLKRLKKLKGRKLNRSVSLWELLKRPEINLEDLKCFNGLPEDITPAAWKQVEIQIKYAGFIQRQLAEVEKFKNLENIKIPPDLDYLSVPSLSTEIKEKLINFKPQSLGQASRISGVTPAAISMLMVWLRKKQPSRPK